MACLVCFASCSNGSSDSGGSQGSPYDINNSLGNPPAENLSFENLGLKFSAKENSEGIYLEFDYPKSEDYWRTIVYVEGLGTIAEEVQDFDTTKTKGCFFYPFVDAGKEYTIRFVSFANEKKDENGFVINGDTVLAWFETKVTAGAKSKGEVRFTSKGRISVDKRGNFKFTKRPTFQNEHLLGNNWVVEIGLVEGISWAHGDERKTDWHGSVQIPQADLLKQINFFEKCPWLPGIDFICVRPVLENYEHNGKEYRYQWDGPAVDTPGIKTEEELWASIDVKTDAAKIKGTWTYGWEDDTEFYRIPVHRIYNEILTIAGTNVKCSRSYTYTKLDGSAFTKEELLDDIGAYSYRHENVASSDVKEFENKLNQDKNVLKFEQTGNGSDDNDETYYEYRIYTLSSNSTLSNNGKTLTQKYEDSEQTLSEYFADYKNSSGSSTEHYDLKLFDDGNTLKIICSGKDHGNDYSYWTEYKKQ